MNKYFICPMSKNIVDVVIEMNSKHIGLLPSRRQIEYNGGYVNNWNTNTFVQYVREKTNIIIERDHAGIGQNYTDEYESYRVDATTVDIVHVDPWKHYKKIDDGINETKENINFLFKLNSKLKYEIGTEESIRFFTENELRHLLNELKETLSTDEFNNITHVAIQSGVGLDLTKRKNVGHFNLERLISMVQVCKEYGKQSKEHNGDYLNQNDIEIRFKMGLDTINIGPEIAQIETETILSFMNEKEKDEFYNICFNSGTWKKWVSLEFDELNKENLIMVCGHYNFQKLNEVFKITEEITNRIKKNIKTKLESLLEIV